VIFLAVVRAVAVFAVQNREDVTIKYLDRSLSCPMAVLVGAVYLLGMISGWTVVGILKRSLQCVTERSSN
jgi:lipopolysaccharide assembly protein A